MTPTIRRYALMAAALFLVPSIAQAGIVAIPRGVQGTQADFQYGPLRFHPKAILLGISVTNPTVAHFRVRQRGNVKDRFRAVMGCAIKLDKRPHVSMDGNVGTIHFPSENLLIGLDFLCTVTVLGEGGVTGQLPVYVTVGA